MNANRIDTSKIGRMDIRQRIASNEATRSGILQEIAAAEEPYRARFVAIEEEMAAATAALQARLDEHDQTAANDENEVYAFDDDGRPVRCCLSGLVLLTDDHLIEDLKADNFALAEAVAGWPAEPQDLPDLEEAQAEYKAA